MEGADVRDKLDALPPDERAEISEQMHILVSLLSKYLDADIKIGDFYVAPQYVRYEAVTPAEVPVATLYKYAEDIEYELAARAHIRMELPVTGKRAIAVEVPRKYKSTVLFKDLICEEEFVKSGINTALLGTGHTSGLVMCDMEKVPHLLVAGQTGSGKSVFLKTLIASLMCKATPDDLRFIFIDTKGVELCEFDGCPFSLSGKVIHTVEEAFDRLAWANDEINRRYELFLKAGCNNIRKYNEHCKSDITLDAPRGKKLPHIYIVADELSDMMCSEYKSDIEKEIKNIAAKSRAAGIHLVLCTQRPSADVITGTIKADLTSRVAFRTSSQIDSRIILDVVGAEALCGRGDMLYYPVDAQAPVRVQGAYIEGDELEELLGMLKRKYPHAERIETAHITEKKRRPAGIKNIFADIDPSEKDFGEPGDWLSGRRNKVENKDLLMLGMNISYPDGTPLLFFIVRNNDTGVRYVIDGAYTLRYAAKKLGTDELRDRLAAAIKTYKIEHIKQFGDSVALRINDAENLGDAAMRLLRAICYIVG